MHSQIRYVGPELAAKKPNAIRVYLGRAYDALNASSLPADFLVVAGLLTTRARGVRETRREKKP